MQFQDSPSNYQNHEYSSDDFDADWVPDPRGKFQQNQAPSPTGLISIIKSGSLDSLVTNPWLVSIFIATIISILIASIAVIIQGQRSTELTPEQETQQALLQKSQNLEASDSNFREYLTRNDYSSGMVSNPGLLQAAVLEASARYRNRIVANQNNPQNQAYNLHEEVINYGSEIEALKRINLGASGKEAELRYIDPSTDSWVTIPLDSAELTASGLVKLNIISNSRRETTQRFDLITIAQNTRKALSDIKNTRVEALRVKGLAPIAEQLEKTDWFGNTINPPLAAEISDYQQYKGEPKPKGRKSQPLDQPPKPTKEEQNE
ncbi:hypothetical protein NIES4071_41650 [Calothrix sp. NIES-4071]|nr:hypothetical protein NIES4071_41650 [Calothrix sp. NIES-4071]BAZ58481.1 hypothetical protein NIES4105_41590 [Calothrix sp. NIES-4105]